MSSVATSALTVIVVTDLVSSTAQRSALGEAAADALSREVHALTTEVVSAHGGAVIKGMGDGALATFSGAADAVAAAIEVQQAVTGAHPVQLRVGISVGDVHAADGDVLGLPVIEASRLCSVAEAGQILVADVVRVLAHGRAGDVFRAVGALELKGLPTALAAASVEWEDLAGVRYPRPEFPSGLVDTSGTIFVGRALEIGMLQRATRSAEAGRRRTLVLTGEDGVGKTRLVGEASRVIKTSRAKTLVVLVRCDDNEVARKPLFELLRGATDGWRRKEIRAAFGATADAVTSWTRGGPSGVVLDASVEELAAAVIALLGALSAEDPLIAVIDDVHLADPDTRSVIAAVANAHHPARLVLVLTSTDVSDGVAFGAAAHHHPVEALSREEIGWLLEFATGHALSDLDSILADAAIEAIGSRPLHILHLMGLMRQRGVVIDEGSEVRTIRVVDKTELPDTLDEVIGERLLGLDPPSRSIFIAAARMGRDVDPAQLSEALDVPLAQVLKVFAGAERLRLATASADVPGSFSFGHASVRRIIAAAG